jgi:pyruvate formate lyase activating enzyme
MEAYLYESLETNKVRCKLCRHRCVIDDGRRGICGVRENRQGVLYTLVYDRIIARNVDPIEKKPLFHLLPGSRSYSIATVGCNFTCRHCQNADIAQMPADRDGMIAGQSTTPEQIVADARRCDCASIAYTYTEPTVFFELAYETARRAHSQGLKNVFVTNGYMSVEALEMIQPYLDAANVDLKAFNPKFYREICGGRLKHVLASLEAMKTRGVFVEITTLLIPGLNDDPEELKALAAFVVEKLGPETPWHVSRFHPTYRLTDRPATPVATLTAARDIGRQAGLHYVYTGNVPGNDGENTFCPACGRKVIERWGFAVREYAIQDGCCRHCGHPIHGVGL